jgi:hypothetical protein
MKRLRSDNPERARAGAALLMRRLFGAVSLRSVNAEGARAGAALRRRIDPAPPAASPGPRSM